MVWCHLTCQVISYHTVTLCHYGYAPRLSLVVDLKRAAKYTVYFPYQQAWNNGSTSPLQQEGTGIVVIVSLH